MRYVHQALLTKMLAKREVCVAYFPLELVIPKFHGEKLVDVPDEDLSEILVSNELPPLCSTVGG
jgi:hypothetical protein